MIHCQCNILMMVQVALKQTVHVDGHISHHVEVVRNSHFLMSDLANSTTFQDHRDSIVYVAPLRF